MCFGQKQFVKRLNTGENLSLSYLILIIYIILGMFYANMHFPRGKMLGMIRTMMEEDLDKITQNEVSKNKIFRFAIWVVFVLFVFTWPKHWIDSNKGGFS